MTRAGRVLSCQECPNFLRSESLQPLPQIATDTHSCTDTHTCTHIHIHAHTETHTHAFTQRHAVMHINTCTHRCTHRQTDTHIRTRSVEGTPGQGAKTPHSSES